MREELANFQKVGDWKNCIVIAHEIMVLNGYKEGRGHIHSANEIPFFSLSDDI